MTMISLAQPFEAEFAYTNDGKQSWAPCLVVGVKDAGLSQSLICIATSECGQHTGAFEVDEVRPVEHRGLRHIAK